MNRLGPYLIIDIFGEGGAGIVYRARHEKTGREVAIKVLKSAHIDRIRREQSTATRLRHPAIATVYEVGQEGDTVFAVMEPIHGLPLTRVEAELNRKIAIIEKAARAVHYAHEQGVVHGDLTPGNILVDDRGEPHLLDFGLSRDLRRPDEGVRNGAVSGTPHYMSPEQAGGRTDAVDARSDVYSLGSILYEILSGHPPFVSKSTGDTVRRVITEHPSLPPGSAILAMIALKALEKDPAHRYPTAAAFADNLAIYLAKNPV